MRASVDANVLISFLLNPASTSPPAQVLVAGLQNDYQLCLSEGLLREVNASVRKKPYLSAHIEKSHLDELIELLRRSAEIMRNVPDDSQRRVRDPNDDYLVTHALLAHVDYFVTGDKDLLELEQVQDVHIVTPAEFLMVLNLESGES